MFVVVEKDCYFDGDDSPTSGFASIPNVFGPFPDRATAEAFVEQKDVYQNVEFDIYEVKVPV